MAANYVEVVVKSRDDAKADIDELRAKLDDLGKKVSSARVTVDDGAAAAKLDRMRAKLLELDHMTARPAEKIRMSGLIRAEAELHMMEATLDNLSRKEDEVIAKAGAGGLLGRILGGAGGGIPGQVSMPFAGGVPLPALAAIVPAVGAVLTEVVALASGFAAAGAGAAAFGILAMPAIKNVEQALKDAHNPKKLAKLHLSGDEAGAVGQLHALGAEYKKLSLAFEPTAFKVFNDVLKVANNLLPVVTPFATAFANALDGLAKHLGKFTQSSGFKDWLHQFQQLVGPATTAIGQGLGRVVIEFGKLLTIFSAKDVVNAINIAFTVLADTIGALAYGVNRFRQNWDGMVSAFDKSRHVIASTFDAVRHNVADLGHYWAGVFDRMRHDVAAWADHVRGYADRVVGWFRALPGRVVGALAALPGQLFSLGQHVVSGFIHGMESMVGGIAASAGHMVASLGGTVMHLLGISSPSKVAHWWGQMIAQGLAGGIDEHAHLAAAAAGRMAGGIGHGLGAPYGGRGGLRIQLELVGGASDEMLKMLRKQIRVKGGNVQTVLGHGS